MPIFESSEKINPPIKLGWKAMTSIKTPTLQTFSVHVLFKIQIISILVEVV